MESNLRDEEKREGDGRWEVIGEMMEKRVRKDKHRWERGEDCGYREREERDGEEREMEKRERREIETEERRRREVEEKGGRW